jgi:hypothetical protein
MLSTLPYLGGGELGVSGGHGVVLAELLHLLQGQRVAGKVQPPIGATKKTEGVRLLPFRREKERPLVDGQWGGADANALRDIVTC